MADCVGCHHALRDGASFCGTCGQAQPVVDMRTANASIKLAIDVTTLQQLAVGARGLLRWRIENSGPLPVELVTL